MHRSTTALALLVALLTAAPAMGAQTWRDKRLFFGDAHWHSCLSQDADRETSLTNQYESMLFDYGLDFSLESDHAEAASAGIRECEPYLPFKPVGNPKAPTPPYTGEEIADAMKAAADDWNGRQRQTPTGTITFVTFPGYEWAPDARCWQATAQNPFPNDYNSDDDTPGHINYFFDGTSGWTYHDDVWEPGDGDSTICATASALGLTYYTGSKDWIDEILGQLVHQRDDPDRSYDLFIQYNHPAATIDKGGTSDHLAKWYDFEHGTGTCSLAPGGEPCGESQCEAMRRAYGVTGVEWYAEQEASIGSTELHHGGGPCTGNPFEDVLSQRCFHDTFHVPERYVTSRGLREGYMLTETGGSDTHSGRRFAPKGFPGSRGAGSRALTVVYADGPTRPAIWEGLNRRRTYALSRFRGIGPVHKGRVDFFTPDPLENAPGVARPLPGGFRVEHGMGEMVEAQQVGTPRDFTIAAAAEQGTTGVAPVELRLYRVSPSTPLSTATDRATFWLDDVPGDPGKLGELLGVFPNTTGSPTLTHTFENVVVRPGDVVFAVVPFSDYTWVDDYYDLNQEPLDADGDGEVDPGKVGYAHTDDNTWARTTPIFFQAAEERSRATASCDAFVTFKGSGSASPEQATGGVDGGVQGDDGVLPVAVPGGVDVEWNRYRFALDAPAQFVDLSFFTAKDEDDVGHLFAVRIDGRLVYSGRAGVDHDTGVLVDKKGIRFPIKAGLHELQVHMDDQEYATADSDADFHCNDYDGPPAFVDGVVFRATPEGACLDATPPVPVCPGNVTVASVGPGGVPASDAAVQAFLASVTVSDSVDPAPTLSNDAPAIFPVGETIVTFTATDAAGNVAHCANLVTVKDATARLDDPAAAKGVAECQKQIDAVGAKLVGVALKSLDKCGQSLLGCAQTIDADKRDKCKAKAGAGCTQELARIAAAEDALAAAVPAKCGAVAFADAASDAGLGYGDDGVTAACGGPVDSFATLGGCLAAEHACSAGRIASRVVPGVRALMTDAGVASDAVPCLADDGGAVVDPATAKLVAQCAKAAGKATSKLAGTVYKSLVKCHETVLACVEQKPDHAKCLAKAGKACGGLVAKIADGNAALADAVVGKCSAAAVAALVADGGAGLGALASGCAAVGVSPESVPDYATCLARSAVCAAEDAVALAAPRSAATFQLGGVAFGSAFCATERTD